MPGDIYSPVDMIKKLVSFDTTSRNSNLELIHFVKDYLAGHGVPAHLIYDQSGQKANLFATVGPSDSPGIALSGHTDVVPVDAQPWETNPFAVVEKNGRLYGRGTADMKSFIAIALALVPTFLQRSLQTPIHLALSFDEEVGCLGAPRMIEQLGTSLVRPKIVIVGEPTDMSVVNAHKSMHFFITRVRGLEAHSSATHRGVNAIAYATELIQFLVDIGSEMRRDRAQPSSGFEPPYTTVHVGTIHGGTAQNIIPLDCVFTWEYRLLPGADPDEIFNRFQRFVRDQVLPRMRAVSPKADIVTETVATAPALVPEPNSPAETLVMALARADRTGVVAYGAEAGQFQEAGIPTVICGPGSIAQAHRPNEYIELGQVEACVVFMHRLLDEVCAA